MSVQFLSQVFKPLASFVFVVPAPANQEQEPDLGMPDERPGPEKPDSPSRQTFEMLYNIDMSSGEGMCLSELYLSNVTTK